MEASDATEIIVVGVATPLMQSGTVFALVKVLVYMA